MNTGNGNRPGGRRGHGGLLRMVPQTPRLPETPIVSGTALLPLTLEDAIAWCAMHQVALRFKTVNRQSYVAAALPSGSTAFGDTFIDAIESLQREWQKEGN